MIELLKIILSTVGQTFFKSKADLTAEIICLRQQLAVYKRKQIGSHLTPHDRTFWCFVSKYWSKWKSVLVIVRPETVLKWHKKRLKQHQFNGPFEKVPGANCIAHEIACLIDRMARENNLWGAPRIHGELLKLGFDVSERSVSRYLRRIHPTDRSQGWKTFLRNQREGICAIDFFSVYTLAFKRIYGLILIDHERRKIIHTAVTVYPTIDWTLQQLLNAFPSECPYEYLVCDNDRLFTPRFFKGVEDLLGASVFQTAKGKPWMNGICERSIGNLRRELLDNIIILNERHLDRVLLRYKDYYNMTRPHIFLEKGAPVSRPIQTKQHSKTSLRSKSILGGLHHKYSWDHVS
jgi:putative transposase